jgi:hypothetical protein
MEQEPYEFRAHAFGAKGKGDVRDNPQARHSSLRENLNGIFGAQALICSLAVRLRAVTVHGKLIRPKVRTWRMNG